MADCKAKDRHVRGERHPFHVLTEQQVVEMRTRYAAGGCSYASLAAHYGVHTMTVAGIVQGKKWRHLLVPR
jgi:hypothetical protein